MQDSMRNKSLKPAKERSWEEIPANIRQDWINLIKIILDVCPECLYERRNDGAYIFVPPEKRESKRNKNLIGIWPEPSGIRLRILNEPNIPEEKFSSQNLSNYKDRLESLYKKLSGKDDSRLLIKSPYVKENNAVSRRTGDYLPNKDDFESAYRMLCSPGENIDKDSILDQIEKTAINSGRNLKTNWRLITERNIEIWVKDA